MSNVFRRPSLSSSSEKLLTLIFLWLKIHQLEEMFLPLNPLEICYCNVEQTSMWSFSLERLISQFKHIVPYSLVHSTQIFLRFTNYLSRNLPRGATSRTDSSTNSSKFYLRNNFRWLSTRKLRSNYQVILALLLHIAKLPERNYLLRSRHACQIMPSHTRETNTKLRRVFPTILLGSFKQPDRWISRIWYKIFEFLKRLNNLRKQFCRNFFTVGRETVRETSSSLAVLLTGINDPVTTSVLTFSSSTP